LNRTPAGSVHGPRMPAPSRESRKTLASIRTSNGEDQRQYRMNTTNTLEALGQEPGLRLANAIGRIPEITGPWRCSSLRPRHRRETTCIFSVIYGVPDLALPVRGRPMRFWAPENAPTRKNPKGNARRRRNVPLRIRRTAGKGCQGVSVAMGNASPKARAAHGRFGLPQTHLPLRFVTPGRVSIFLGVSPAAGGGLSARAIGGPNGRSRRCDRPSPTKRGSAFSTAVREALGKDPRHQRPARVAVIGVMPRRASAVVHERWRLDAVHQKIQRPGALVAADCAAETRRRQAPVVDGTVFKPSESRLQAVHSGADFPKNSSRA